MKRTFLSLIYLISITTASAVNAMEPAPFPLPDTASTRESSNASADSLIEQAVSIANSSLAPLDQLAKLAYIRRQVQLVSKKHRQIIHDLIVKISTELVDNANRTDDEMKTANAQEQELYNTLKNASYEQVIAQFENLFAQKSSEKTYLDALYISLFNNRLLSVNQKLDLINWLDIQIQKQIKMMMQKNTYLERLSSDLWLKIDKYTQGARKPATSFETIIRFMQKHRQTIMELSEQSGHDAMNPLVLLDIACSEVERSMISFILDRHPHAAMLSFATNVSCEAKRAAIFNCDDELFAQAIYFPRDSYAFLNGVDNVVTDLAQYYLPWVHVYKPEGFPPILLFLLSQSNSFARAAYAPLIKQAIDAGADINCIYFEHGAEVTLLDIAQEIMHAGHETVELMLSYGAKHFHELGFDE